MADGYAGETDGEHKDSPSVPFRLDTQIQLLDWQEQAVDAWVAGDGKGPYRGTLEIFTGGGKTLIALEAFARVSQEHPAAKLAVVVPTEALALQWRETLIRRGSWAARDIGLLGAGKRDKLDDRRIVVAVLNSAAKYLPEQSRHIEHLMLIVDECHRAGAKTFSRVLETRALYRLGLSATPARDDVDDDGQPLSFEQQEVGQRLGGIVYRFGLKQARELGWLPSYTVHHHGVQLTPEERHEYDRVSDRVNDAGDKLESLGLSTSAAWYQATRKGERGDAARAYVGAVAARKDLLYRASERNRVAEQLAVAMASREPRPRTLLFHERVEEVEKLHLALQQQLPDTNVALEHSNLPADRRRESLQAFRDGHAAALVSVKSLVEGIDVPDADVGISVASSSSVRQRIQTLGRVLRRRFDGTEKHAEMHVIYVADTVDELIYGKEDWSDLTGADANRYWKWSLDPAVAPEEKPDPPRKPRPTEEQEWVRLGERVPEQPVIWLGELPAQEFSVDTRGNIKTAGGAWIANGAEVSGMVSRVRGRPGGRFRVTPLHSLVIVYGKQGEEHVPFVAGRLTEPLQIRQEVLAVEADVDVSALAPGAHYPGSTTSELGEFRIRQLRGGVIERRSRTGAEFALVSDAEDKRHRNAAHCLQAWRSLNAMGMRFAVNQAGHAWYREGGEPRFLADVSGGFVFPSAQHETEQDEEQPMVSKNEEQE